VSDIPPAVPAARRTSARSWLVALLAVLIIALAADGARSGGSGGNEAGTFLPTPAASSAAPSPSAVPSSAPPSVTPSASHSPTPRPVSTSPTHTGPNNPTADVAAAASYAASHQARTGVAVLDLQTGAYYGAGDATGLFGSASVMKVFIAIELLATGQMTGQNAALATSMIERSDDGAVATLWPLAGGTDVINRVATRYKITNLGTPNTRPGFWGNTHITAKGMVYLYAAVAKDPVVAPWLMNAMAHADRIADDGTNQFFGIPSATTGFSIKQGWGSASADNLNDAIINSTGYVNGNRYAVAILGEGMNDNGSTNSDGYNATLAGVVTQEARLVMPGGRIR
jgi:hypothetical protein